MTIGTFTAADLAACAEREVKQRRRVYRRLADEGRMSPEFADRQIAMMEQIAREYRAEAEAETAEGRLL